MMLKVVIRNAHQMLQAGLVHKGAEPPGQPRLDIDTSHEPWAVGLAQDEDIADNARQYASTCA